MPEPPAYDHVNTPTTGTNVDEIIEEGALTAGRWAWRKMKKVLENLLIYSLLLPILTGGWYYRRSSSLSGIIERWQNFAAWSNRSGPAYRYSAADYARLGFRLAVASSVFWSLFGVVVLGWIWNNWLGPYWHAYLQPLLKSEWDAMRGHVEEGAPGSADIPQPSGSASHTRRGTQSRNRNPHFRAASTFYHGIWTNVDRKLATLFYCSAGTRADEMRIREELLRFAKEDGIIPETMEDDRQDFAEEPPPEDADPDLRARYVQIVLEKERRIKSTIKSGNVKIDVFAWRAIETAFGRLRENPWYLEMKDNARMNSDLYENQAALARGAHVGTRVENLRNFLGRVRDAHGLGSSGPAG
jgi:hypothetical protein